MFRADSYKEYRDLYRGRTPENLVVAEQVLAEICEDPSTIWTPLKGTEVYVPGIFAGEYVGVNNNFMLQRGYRRVGFTSLSELVELPSNFETFDAVLDATFGAAHYDGIEVDELVQFDGEGSTVRYFKAHVIPAAGVEYVMQKGDVSADDFEFIWNTLYHPRFSELSDEFPVSGTLEKDHLWELISKPNSMSIITRENGTITGFCVVCRLEDFESYDQEYARADEGEALKWYCPVIVGNQSASAANALKMAKIMGKNIRSYGGGILYFDCPNRTYPYIQKIVSAMREKDSPVEPRCYARAIFRLLIPSH